jgi:O-antigen ligase
MHIFPEYKRGESFIIWSHANNDYLELLSETGLAGFSILIFGGVFFFWQVFRMWFETEDSYAKRLGAGGLSACIAIFLSSLIDSNLYLPVNSSLLMVIMGLSWCLASEKNKFEKEPL